MGKPKATSKNVLKILGNISRSLANPDYAKWWAAAINSACDESGDFFGTEGQSDPRRIKNSRDAPSSTLKQLAVEWKGLGMDFAKISNSPDCANETSVRCRIKADIWHRAAEQLLDVLHRMDEV